MGQVSREAVLRTQESLIMKLKQQSAREEGICQVLILTTEIRLNNVKKAQKFLVAEMMLHLLALLINASHS